MPALLNNDSIYILESMQAYGNIKIVWLKYEQTWLVAIRDDKTFDPYIYEARNTNLNQAINNLFDSWIKDRTQKDFEKHY